jgi:predicted nucleotide-binding protein
VEQPSDAEGIIYLPFDDSVRETGQKLIQNLHAAGIELDPAKVANF